MIGDGGEELTLRVSTGLPLVGWITSVVDVSLEGEGCGSVEDGMGVEVGRGDGEGLGKDFDSTVADFCGVGWCLLLAAVEELSGL